MNVLALIGRLMDTHETNIDDIEKLAASIVAGKKVSDATIEKAMAKAGVTSAQFAALLHTLQQRHEAWHEYHNRDWETEHQDLMADRRDIRESIEKANKQIADLQAELRRLHDRDRGLLGLAGRLRTEQDDARRACDKTLRATGAPSDWRAIGDPQPKPDRRPKPGERFNIGAGQTKFAGA